MLLEEGKPSRFSMLAADVGRIRWGVLISPVCGLPLDTDLGITQFRSERCCFETPGGFLWGATKGDDRSILNWACQELILRTAGRLATLRRYVGRWHR